MRIAQIAPLTEAIPPSSTAAPNGSSHWLTEELVALGHDVTLFASGDSQTSAKLEPVWPQALRLDGAVRDPNALHMTMLERVRRKAQEFDVLHFHLDYYPFSLFARQPTPFRHHAARPARPAGASAGVRHVLVVAAWSRSRMRNGGRCRRPDGSGRSITACPSSCSCRSRRSRRISLFSAASRRRRRSTARSGSPSAAACRSRSPPRSTGSIATISRARSARCSSSPDVEYHRRDRRQREIGVSQRRRRAAGRRSTGPSRSAWCMIEAMACGTPVIAFNRGVRAARSSRTA